jgi:heat shock protein HtpX
LLIQDSSPNAFASGFDMDNAAITLTSGLLDLLNRDELETVLAHELTHIRNADITLMYSATVIGGWIEFWGDIVMRNANIVMNIAFDQRREKQSPSGAAIIALGAVIMIIAAILSRIFRLAISRSREFLADAGAVELTKNPDALIRALLKLENSGKLEHMPSAIQQMCFSNPVKGVFALFSTHPPVADRVEALVQYAGGRLPQAALAESEPAPAGPWSNNSKKQA